MHGVTPTCRYDHGNLFQITDKDGAPSEWWLMSTKWGLNNIQLGFSLFLWVCPVCGYSEGFDPDPISTLAQVGTDGHS